MNEQTEQPVEQVPNASAAISDIMAKFMRPATSTEAEILEVVARYSLQIRPDQHLILNRLQMLCFNPNVPESAKQAIEAFIPLYQDMKRYHDTLNYIGRTIEALSLKKFIEAKSIQGQIMNVK